MRMSGNGVVYIAYGEPFVRMAARSAVSLKQHHPAWPAVLFTDAKPDMRTAACFDNIRVVPLTRRGFLDKVVWIARSPFNRTLYLDADTYVCAPLDRLFALLDQFDIAAAHAPLRITAPVPSVPDGFPELNAGVIAFRSRDAVSTFFADWLAAYRRDLERGIWQESDQPAFRERLFHSGLRLATLPPEWNCRYNSPGFAEGMVRLLHGTLGDPETVAARLNADLRQRVHLWVNGTFQVTPTARRAPVFE